VEARTEELHRANRVKDEFLGLVSHELRTPVTVIYGNTEILQSRHEHMSQADRKQAIDDLSYESRRLLRIIENLLVLARVELGAAPELLPHNIARLIKTQVESHQRYFQGRRIDVAMENNEVIDCDATYMELIIGNLLSNAEKYSSTDQPIEIQVTSNSGEVMIAVLDRGRGIGLTEVDLLFKPFYRSPEVEGKVSGMGIGLAVCKRLAEMQGGRIWAEPRDGGGSVFGIALPSAVTLANDALTSASSSA
jgi:signal transduction histidine kinase